MLLRQARPDDADALVEMLADPRVAEWWGAYDHGRVHAELAGAYVIEISGRVQGWLFCEEEDDPSCRHVSFDIALSPAVHGHGYGSEALRLAIRDYAARGHHRFSIDPAVVNEQAIRAYRAVGFEPVGVLRAYQRGLDGSWHDNLLMDLLVDGSTG